MLRIDHLYRTYITNSYLCTKSPVSFLLLLMIYIYDPNYDAQIDVYVVRGGFQYTAICTLYITYERIMFCILGMEVDTISPE